MYRNNIFLLHLFTANDLESKGVWVHASTGTDLTWINPRLDCCEAWDKTCYRGDVEGAFVLAILDNRTINGAWCGNPINTEWNFICEAQSEIEQMTNV